MVMILIKQIPPTLRLTGNLDLQSSKTGRTDATNLIEECEERQEAAMLPISRLLPLLRKTIWLTTLLLMYPMLPNVDSSHANVADVESSGQGMPNHVRTAMSHITTAWLPSAI
jgi:hypothetical protein